MAGRNFRVLLDTKWGEGKMLCVGLDPDLGKIPASVGGNGPRERIVAFNRGIIDATHDLVCAFKLNSAFYEAHGDQGFAALRETVFYIRNAAPDVPVILDAKRGDIGNTNDAYAEAVFGYLSVDAITMHPYLGKDALQPMLDRSDKGIFVLCRTSNAGAGEFQDLAVEGKPLYQVVAQHVASAWNTNGNCGLVVGATYPDELKMVRQIAPELPILIPGIGAQNGDIAECVVACRDSHGRGMIIAVSRSIIFASGNEDFAEVAGKKAQKLHGAITATLVR